MSYKKKLSGLADDLGEKGVEELAEILDKEADKASGWKSASLDLLADAARKHGTTGFSLAKRAIERAIEGDSTDIRKATSNLMVASTLLAELQQAEADHKDEIKKWLGAISQTIGAILKRIVGTVL